MGNYLISKAEILWFLPSNFQYKNALTCPVFLSVMLAVRFLIFPLFFQTHKATKGHVPLVQAPGLAFQYKKEIKWRFSTAEQYIYAIQRLLNSIFSELNLKLLYFLCVSVCMCVYIYPLLWIFRYYIYLQFQEMGIHFDILYSKCTHELVQIVEAWHQSFSSLFQRNIVQIHLNGY